MLAETKQTLIDFVILLQCSSKKSYTQNWAGYQDNHIVHSRYTCPIIIALDGNIRFLVILLIGICFVQCITNTSTKLLDRNICIHLLRRPFLFSFYKIKIKPNLQLQRRNLQLASDQNGPIHPKAVQPTRPSQGRHMFLEELLHFLLVPEPNIIVHKNKSCSIRLQRLTTRTNHNRLRKKITLTWQTQKFCRRSRMSTKLKNA